MVWESPEATPSVFTAANAESLPDVVQAPAGVSPFVTGLTESDVVFGQAFLFPPAEDDATTEAPEATPISGAVAELSGPSHSGAFASALHATIHPLESAALAADRAVADGSEDAAAAIDEVAALLATTSQAVAEVEVEADNEERAEVQRLLDAVGVALDDARQALP